MYAFLLNSISISLPNKLLNYCLLIAVFRFLFNRLWRYLFLLSRTLYISDNLSSASSISFITIYDNAFFYIDFVTCPVYSIEAKKGVPYLGTPSCFLLPLDCRGWF